MFQLDAFIEQGHRKVIEHYRRLRDTATSEAERAEFERRMAAEHDALMRDTGKRGAQRAA